MLPSSSIATRNRVDSRRVQLYTAAAVAAAGPARACWELAAIAWTLGDEAGRHRETTESAAEAANGAIARALCCGGGLEFHENMYCRDAKPTSYLPWSLAAYCTRKTIAKWLSVYSCSAHCINFVSAR